jgi:G2/mitotic-specific cyclin 2
MNKQPRRTTRATRSTKDTENVNARPSRLATRTKPSTTSTAISRATAPTVATKAKTIPNDVKADIAAQGKRKRAALGELTAPSNINNKEKPSATSGKGKEKAKVTEKFDAVVLRKALLTTSTTTTACQPLRVVAGGSSHTRGVSVVEQVKQLEQVKEETGVGNDDLMSIDPPTHVKAEIRETKALRRVSLRKQGHQAEEADDEESQRVHKKRRTSSDISDDDVPREDPVPGEAENFTSALLSAKRSTTPEADPDGDQWEDLDAEDVDDPLMVSEYVNEIFSYLKEVEVGFVQSFALCPSSDLISLQQTTMPNPNYMEMQKDLAWKMRGILTDWLIQVHSRFRLLPETLFLCVNIIDRFLSARVVSLIKLQLVGITCMFISAKVEEIVSPSASNFLYCADSSYSEAEILQAERYVLKTLDWNLSYPNPIHFLRRISKADQYNVQTRTIAKYLMEIQCLEWRLLSAPPSILAAASVWLARLILGREDWVSKISIDTYEVVLTTDDRPQTLLTTLPIQKAR